VGLEDFPLEQTVADVALAAHFLTYVVIANRRYTDLFEWVRWEADARSARRPDAATGCRRCRWR
jgi:hypothetical protein